VTLLVSAAAVLAMPGEASASHFRGGQMEWTRLSGNTVEITTRTAWRADFVDAFSLNTGGGSPSSVFSGNPPGVFEGQFTDSTGTSYRVYAHTTTVTYPGDGPYTASFSSCCRIGALSNAANGNYDISTVVDLSNGNTGSPATAQPMIAQLTAGGVQLIVPPIAESDGYTCSLVTGTDSGIPANPSGPSGSLAVGSGCSLVWDTTGVPIGSLYAYQLRITDGNGAWSTFDGMIEIVGTTSNFPPSCAPGTTDLTVGPGTAISHDFIGSDPDGDPLSVSVIGSLPPGSSLAPTGGPSPLTSTFSWTPTAADLGGYAFSVQFQDSGNLSGICGLSVNVVGCVDDDNDGVCNDDDNCPIDDNPLQDDSDNDGAGDACDICPLDADDDADNDGECADSDNCPLDNNADQADSDGDGAGDACDVCPDDADDDADDDGVCGDVDNCPADDNSGQDDADNDGLGDACDACALDPTNDGSDGDGVCDDVDNCLGAANSDQADSDSDGAGDVCDVCPLDPTDDGSDGDGVCDDVDNCLGVSNSDQADSDGDSAGDACDVCPNDATDDGSDGDGVCDDVDNCLGLANSDQTDNDGDGAGDACDVCPYDPDDDLDGDGVCGDEDICPDTWIPEQNVPSNRLGSNRWALLGVDSLGDGDGWFEQGRPGKGPFGPGGELTVEDTYGCSCEQIADICELGNGHYKFGCSNGVMWNWVSSGGETCEDE
jgi:hypothetical protein